ncbi:MAG: methyltransferase RsmF C-terminal domain-like protein [Mangrovibacterium sp.]
MTIFLPHWPKDFTQRIEQQFPKDTDAFLTSLENKPRTSIRINPNKFNLSFQLETVPWSKYAYFLNQRPNFALDPLWHAGAYYVQEASSMFLEQALKFIHIDSPKSVLDLCAAPGGKSTHLNSLIKPDDLLLSNELIRSRASILYENLTKWGYHNHMISNNDPKQFGELGALFDVVLIDAPCSGEGLFRRDAKAAEEWSIENTKLCAVRQRRIFADSLNCLKEGGYLVYSTCTFNPSENEENLAWLSQHQGFESIQIPIDKSWGVDEVTHNGLYGYRFLPHKVTGEGFFISLLRKTEGTQNVKFPKKLRSIFQKTKIAPTDWLKTTDDKIIYHHKEQIKFAPKNWEKEISYLQQKLNLIKIGNSFAEQRKNSFSPTADLAFSTALNKNAFDCRILSQEDCLNFLARENFNRNNDNKKSWELICFQNIPLGFIKEIGNRYNNYYPKEWRLRTTNREDLMLWYKPEK